MKNPRHTLACALLLATLLGPSFAQAGGTAHAAIGNVRLGVLDLTPDDGIAPGFSVQSTLPSLFASLNAPPADYYAAGYPGPQQPATVSVAFGTSTGTSATDGALTHFSAHATGAGNLGEFGYAAASANQEVQVTLAPYSVLTVAGHLSSLALRSDDIEHYDVVGMTSVSIVDEIGYTYLQRARQSLSYADWPERMAIEEDFMLAYANGSATEQAVTVYFLTWANVTRMAAPVPEPAMGALMAAGVLLLGCRGINRLRRQPMHGRARRLTSQNANGIVRLLENLCTTISPAIPRTSTREL
ncbi:hypothetical protein [Pseudoduganella chitinolytica]|uniref:PEP-CTERM sorting domain-containing protein n=1 Tax=Pseudoduganella chitinolytica TaxID=34070 RepID=A0ABY8BC81_9BURK|nr:hypothetical protein [Pseudoduganella chitinolytica]WEF33512.1 hypothetical protein PX653_01595 [Pseudoduganella chitinolytica]